MNILDITITLIVGYNLFSGLKNGAIKMVSGLVGIGVGIILSQPVFNIFFPILNPYIPVFKTYPFVFYGICFLFILISCQIGLNIVDKMFKWTGLAIINTILGIILGFTKGIIISLVIIIPLSISQSSFTSNSIIIANTKPQISKVTSQFLKTQFFSDLFNSSQDLQKKIPAKLGD